MSRRRPFGRFLGRMPAAVFLPYMPCQLQAGFELSATTRPYLTNGGAVNVRLVFRDRSSGVAMMVSFPLRGALTDDLHDALNDVIGPHPWVWHG
jgi:hypothetical protein